MEEEDGDIRLPCLSACLYCSTVLFAGHSDCFLSARLSQTPHADVCSLAATASSFLSSAFTFWRWYGDAAGAFTVSHHDGVS